MRLMVGVGRERDQHREKCLSVSRKSVVFFFVMMLDVGTIFFFVWLCGGGGGCEKKVHTLKGQGAHFLNCFLLVHIAFFPSSSSII